MIGKDWKISDERLKEILECEFGISLETGDEMAVARARSAVACYESVPDFLEQTGWRRDNPELSEEHYLTENRICRWINGRFMYFSRLLWEEEH